MPHSLMIVENDPDVLLLWQYTQVSSDAVFYCEGGISALKQLSRIHYKVEAIIIDLMLGDMDGVTLTEQIRRNESIRSLEYPILIFWFTGYDMNATLLKAKTDLKVTEIFIKPMAPDKLLNQVKGYLTVQRESAESC